MNTGLNVQVGCALCGNLAACICGLRERHDPSCRFLRAASLSIELECTHGYQACPECDPCDCHPRVEEVGVR